MLKDARLREQGTSMNVMKERRGEGEERERRRRKEGGQTRLAERSTLKVTNRQIRKQEKELGRSYHSTSMLFVNKGDSIEKKTRRCNTAQDE